MVMTVFLCAIASTGEAEVSDPYGHPSIVACTPDQELAKQKRGGRCFDVFEFLHLQDNGRGRRAPELLSSKLEGPGVSGNPNLSPLPLPSCLNQAQCGPVLAPPRT
eukprot:913420-Amphidinium_carterae.1